jgi:hypothetical protein
MDLKISNIISNIRISRQQSRQCVCKSTCVKLSVIRPKQGYITNFKYSINNILNDKPVELNEKSVNKCKDSLESFDKDLIRRVVVGDFFFETWICFN